MSAFPAVETRPALPFTAVENLDTLVMSQPTVKDVMLTEDQQLILDAFSSEDSMDARRTLVGTLSRPERDDLATLVRDNLISDPEIMRQAAELIANVPMQPESPASKETAPVAVEKPVKEGRVKAPISDAQRARFGPMVAIYSNSTPDDRRRFITALPVADHLAFVEFLNESKSTRGLATSASSFVRMMAGNAGVMPEKKTADKITAFETGQGFVKDANGLAMSAKNTKTGKSGYRFEIMSTDAVTDDVVQAAIKAIDSALTSSNVGSMIRAIAAMPGAARIRVASVGSGPNGALSKGERRVSPVMSIKPAYANYMSLCAAQQTVAAALVFQSCPPTNVGPNGEPAFPGGTLITKLR